MEHYTRIKDLREDSDLTQEQLCKKLFMHKTTYTNYEQGKHTVPLDFAVTLAEFYGVSLDYIAGRSNHIHGNTRPDFSEDEIKLIDIFRGLSERSKGKLELYAEMLSQKENEDIHRAKGAV